MPAPDDHPFLSRTPPRAPEGLIARARALGAPPRVALVNAGAPLPLAGLREACEAGLAEPVLVGDPAKIRAAAERIGWDIAPFRLVAAPGETAAPEAAKLAAKGEADALMKGQVHTSAFLKGILPASMGLRAKGAVCAHVFHVTLPRSERPLLLTDAALNVRPDLHVRQQSLCHAVCLARLVGVARPRVGILAPSEDVTLAIPCTGEVDVILVPELNAGNALFKLMVLGMGACAAGVVMGARVPILLTSRGQGAEDRLASAALGAILGAEARSARAAA